MTSRICKFGCQTLLEGFDEQARKYIEAGTGGLHTKERCQEAKLKLEAKNDHGNEDYGGVRDLKIIKDIEQKRADYIDHTQGPKLKLKILQDPTPEGLSHLYNSFGESHNIRFSQYQMVLQISAGSLYTIAVWYEEVIKQ